jgi:hypothetical protein
MSTSATSEAKGARSFEHRRASEPGQPVPKTQRLRRGNPIVGSIEQRLDLGTALGLLVADWAVPDLVSGVARVAEDGRTGRLRRGAATVRAVTTTIQVVSGWGEDPIQGNNAVTKLGREYWLRGSA